jgi:hypothetical protein
MVVKTLFLRWVDLEEMRKVTNQSWFHRIKGWLDSGVTISLPFVTLTFEPGVQPEFFSQREAEDTALKLVKNSILIARALLSNRKSYRVFKS